MVKFRRSFYLLFVLLSLTTLSSCISLELLRPQVSPPNFQLAGLPYVESISLPIIGSGEVVLRLPIEVYNPNPISLNVESIDFDLYLNSQYALSSGFYRGFAIIAQETHYLELEVRIPILRSIALFPEIQGLIEGRPTLVNLEGSVTINVFGNLSVLARTTLLRGSVQLTA